MSIDGVAGRAGDVAHDCPVLAEQGVQQARLADVRAPDQGDRHRLLLLVERNRQVRATLRRQLDRLFVAVENVREPACGHVARPFVRLGLTLLASDLLLAFGRQCPHDRVEQIRHTAAVSRADRVRLLPAQGVELGRFKLALLVVGLVRGHEHGRLGRSKQVRGFEVGRRQAGDRVDDEHDEVCFADGQPSLLLDPLFDRIAGMDLEAARVNDDEAAPVPVGVAVDAVSGRSGTVLDDRSAVADNAVEQGALADVRAPDDGDDWKWYHRWIMGHGGPDAVCLRTERLALLAQNAARGRELRQ